MTKTNALQSLLPKILFVSFVIFSVNIFCLAQNKADLEIKVQPASETARGGENFSYTVTVNNIGSAKATDVIFIQTKDWADNLVSYIPSKGSCELDDNQTRVKRELRCKLGDLEAGESISTLVELKIREFGGEYEPKDMEIARKSLIESLQRITGNTETDSKGSLIANIYVTSENPDDNNENNSAAVFVNLLPSKNLPPRIEIISPKNEAVIVRQANKAQEVILTVKAFDPDGEIEKVVVEDPEYLTKPTFEDNQYKFIYDGKKYTAQELTEHFKTVKPIERTAIKIGENTYTYSLKNTKFGQNRIVIGAIDNGGRINATGVEFKVTGDAQIEIVSPKKEQVFTPNSTIKIETISTINDPAFDQLRITGTRNNFYPPEWTDYPLLEQISKAGNSFKNQYIWKNVPEGVYRLEAVLLNGSMPTNYSEQIKIIVAEPRIIKIFSLKSGQEFEAGRPIKISVYATDVKGRIVKDELELLVDGKYQTEVYDSWINEPVPPYKQVLDETYGYNLTGLEKGVHTIQIIARQKEYSGKGAILGKSEIITIKVK